MFINQISGTRMKEELVERLTSFPSDTLITVNFVKPSTKTYRFDVADAEEPVDHSCERS